MILNFILAFFLQVMPVGIFNISGANTASTSNFLSVKSAYAMSYDGIEGRANWVAWTLLNADLGSIPRSNKFIQDDSFPNSFYVIDRTSTLFLNRETFLMSNMLPQTPELNRGPWERLEAYCRKLVKGGQKLVIYAGGIGSLNALGSTRMPIPKYCWKVIYTPDKVWCLLFPNEKTLNPNWQTYSIPLSQLKKMTGYKFP